LLIQKAAMDREKSTGKALGRAGPAADARVP